MGIYKPKLYSWSLFPLIYTWCLLNRLVPAAAVDSITTPATAATASMCMDADKKNAHKDLYISLPLLFIFAFHMGIAPAYSCTFT